LRIDEKTAVVQNGYHCCRKITFESDTIDGNVPKYMRRSFKIDETIPLLCLTGISTGNME
jgi:hypothetical protein